jgi:hypothetical protein
LTNIFRKITNWEAWPFKLIYAPLAPVWVWNILRSRAVWFFTPSNPKLTFGGMDGEPKKEMYDLLPPDLYPATFNVLPSHAFETISAKLSEKKIVYPFIVKPEVGCAGVLFRKIENEEELRNYHMHVPVEYILQEMILYPLEVSVFYIRHPQEKKGIITGFLHKIPLNVEGDGTSTLEQLILMHPKAAKRSGELHSRHRENWQSVIPSGEKYMLSHAANHNRGAHFIDLKEHIDDDLLAIFDEISHRINDFFYGRYDILCSSIQDLKAGKNFSILEYNGCGAEPNHIYDTGYSLKAAYKEILKHWKALYEISRHNRLQGVKPWPLIKGMQFRYLTNRHYKIIKKADADIR